MSRAEMTYNEVLASWDRAKAVRELSDSDLVQLRVWLASGARCGEVADKLHGLCILVEGERFEREVMMGVQLIQDIDHGSEVGQ